jgi:hypothetical protein
MSEALPDAPVVRNDPADLQLTGVRQAVSSGFSLSAICSDEAPRTCSWRDSGVMFLLRVLPIDCFASLADLLHDPIAVV